MRLQMPGSVYQVACVVPDIEAAARQWAQLAGAGPFMLFPHFEFIDPHSEGRPAGLDVSVALGFSDGLCMELIQQHDERPSIYHDWRIERGYGLHHVALLSDDFTADVERREADGARAVFTAGFGDGTRLAYLDTREALDCYLEIVEFSDFVRAALGVIRDAHDDWDGRDVVREFPA